MATAALRFGSDEQVLRSEDPPLITGQGRFTDDINVPGQSFGHFLRAPVAHATIRSIDTAAARRVPGVLGVFVGADLVAEGLGTIPPVFVANGRDGKPMAVAPISPLAVGKMRYAGEPVALIVAETLAAAQDAAERVAIDYEELRAVSDPEQALAPGAPELWSQAPGNLVMEWVDGDDAAAEKALAASAHVERVRLADTRLAPSAMEPRAAIGQWDAAAGRYILTASTQGVAVVRKLLAEGVFKTPLSTIRVLTQDVGGGFGMKAQTYPEYAALLFAARKVGRPVKWCATRLESFLSDSHGRDGVFEGEMGFDKRGRITAFRMRNVVGLGACTTQYCAVFGTTNTKNCLSSVYRIPVIRHEVKLALTNAAPLGPYRGAGRPEAIYMIERLLDAAAPKLKIDRVELRRRNFIPRDAMPYKTACGPIYDSGDFEAAMDKALAIADWKGFAGRRRQSAKEGKLRGIGLCCFLEIAGGILNEKADLRFASDGKAEIRVGVQAMGQGHLSTLPGLIARRLGIDLKDVRLIEGDSDEVPDGTPSVASRSLMMAGSAMVRACDAAIDKGRRVAGHLFEVAVDDVEFADGRFRVRGTDLATPILELAAKAKTVPGLPEEIAGGLDNVAEFVSPQMSFPNGCHVCEVEVDTQTGVVAIVGYSAVDDVGNIVHETIVDGQVHGGVAQGLGQVLGEHVIYGADGQLVNASFMDYVMPRAQTMPLIKTSHHSVACTNNPLGVKGAGESGVAGALPSAMNAVIDALSSRGITHFDLPASPERVWAALAKRSA